MSLVLAIVAGAAVVARLKAAPVGRSRALALLGTLLMVGAATQAFGFTGVPRGPVVVAPSADGAARRSALKGAAFAPTTTAQEIVAAAEVELPPGGHGVYLSPSSDAAVHPVQAQQWYLALTSGWTLEANARTEALMPPPGIGPIEQTDADRARRVLTEDPTAVIVVGRGRLAGLHEKLGTALAARVIGF